ncbi:MAG: Hypothetical protein COG2043, partial [uncultured Sphingomonas sp.]
ERTRRSRAGGGGARRAGAGAVVGAAHAVAAAADLPHRHEAVRERGGDASRAGVAAADQRQDLLHLPARDAGAHRGLHHRGRARERPGLLQLRRHHRLERAFRPLPLGAEDGGCLVREPGGLGGAPSADAAGAGGAVPRAGGLAVAERAAGPAGHLLVLRQSGADDPVHQRAPVEELQAVRLLHHRRERLRRLLGPGAAGPDGVPFHSLLRGAAVRRRGRRRAADGVPARRSGAGHRGFAGLVQVGAALPDHALRAASRSGGGHGQELLGQGL